MPRRHPRPQARKRLALLRARIAERNAAPSAGHALPRGRRWIAALGSILLWRH